MLIIPLLVATFHHHPGFLLARSCGCFHGISSATSLFAIFPVFLHAPQSSAERNPTDTFVSTQLYNPNTPHSSSVTLAFDYVKTDE